MFDKFGNVNHIFRRGKLESGDIDALITHPSLIINSEKNKGHNKLLKSIVTALNDLITDTISMGDTKFMVRVD